MNIGVLNDIEQIHLVRKQFKNSNRGAVILPLYFVLFCEENIVLDKGMFGYEQSSAVIGVLEDSMDGWNS